MRLPNALLGCLAERQPRALVPDPRANVKKLWHTIPILAIDEKHDFSQRGQGNNLALPFLEVATETDSTYPEKNNKIF
jgi:hypothetical protein